MSSTEITTCEDARKRPPLPLPTELRLKVYEQLLVLPDRSLKPSGFRHRDPRYFTCEKDKAFISILLTCRTIYEEALPILYGKNVLAFHGHDISNPLLPFSFPEGYLIMIKHVKVEIRPSLNGSAEKMGNFLMLLGTSGANLIDIHINIDMVESFDMARRTLPPPPPLSLFDRFLVGDHPIVAGLFSLKTPKKMVIKMENETRFEPGVANALKKAFMEEGTACGRSITIVHRCEVLWPKPCPQCAHTNDLGFVDLEYEDDILSWQAVEKFVLLGGTVEKRKSWEAESTT